MREEKLLRAKFKTPTTSVGSSSDLNLRYPTNAKREDKFAVLETTTRLPVLLTQSFCCIIEDCIQQLAILGSIGNLPKKAEVDINPMPLNERFNNNASTALIFHPETLEPFELSLKREKAAKLQKDRSYIESILKETLLCLRITDTFEALERILQEYDYSILEEQRLLDNESESRLKLQEILSLVMPERKIMLNKIQKLNNKIGQLQDEMQDIIYDMTLKKNYVNKWEVSREEQHDLGLFLKEEYYSRIIRTVESKVDKEFRVHLEIENFILETQKDHTEKIETWKDSYYEALELQETKMNLLKGKRELQLLKLKELTEEYQKRQREISEYLIVREKRRIEAEILETRIAAAIKIQAWWRGTMVRKCLGPFNPKKGKKGKEDEKKKGKKK